MNFTFEIAKRYLLGKKSTSAINIITWISVIGITIGTAALILILSIFNGFESLLSGMNNSFNPDIKVIPSEGKYFEVSDHQTAQINDIPGIIAISKTIEEVCIFEYKDNQKAGKIKGVDAQYRQVSSIDSSIKSGTYKVIDNNRNFGVLGRGLSSNLSINHKDAVSPVVVHMPTRSAKGMLGKLGKEYTSINVFPAGIFSVGSEADVTYLISNIESVSKLLDRKNQISSLEIKLSEDHDEDDIKASINTILGEGFTIKNRYEQEETFLKVMNIEKWVSFLIVLLTLGIIAFNMVGSLWMMVLEKKQDIAILRSMGYETKRIRAIFMMEGMLITAVGIVIGIVIALFLYWLQKDFGLIAVPDGFMISAYPIELKWTDFVIVIFAVSIIGWLASLLPSYRAGLVSSFVRQEL